MHTIYLDDSIIAAMEHGRLTKADITHRLGGGEIELLYSPLHIIDALQLPETIRQSAKTRQTGRLRLLGGLEERGCILSGENGQFLRLRATPTEAAATITRLPYADWMRQGLAEKTALSKNFTFRQRLNITHHALNQLAPPAIKPFLESAAVSAGMEAEITKVIRDTVSRNVDTDNLAERYEQIATLWQLLEKTGYTGEKEAYRGGEASFLPWGALHASFATRATSFLTLSYPKARIVQTVYAWLQIPKKAMVINANTPVFSRALPA